MKILSVALLLSACSWQSAQAVDAICPLYELYPSPPYYIYYCHYFDPAGNCNENEIEAYDYWYYETVPYYSCEHCRDPDFTRVKKVAAAEEKPKPPLATKAAEPKPHRKFPGLTEPIDESYQYELPRGPDNSGPEGKPDGIGDARQYGTATSLIKGRTRIVKFKKTADGPDCYAKVFQLTLRLKERSDANQKRLATPPNDPIDHKRIDVIYFAMELANVDGGYATNATLEGISPGDDSDPCHLFLAKCKMEGEGDEDFKPITILTVVKHADE